MSSEKNNVRFWRIVAIAALCACTVLTTLYATKPSAAVQGSGSHGAATGSADQSANDSATQASTHDTDAPTELCLAATFPSWSADSVSLAGLVAFVEDACDPASPDYRECAERIATFDMDGTVLAEKDPLSVDNMLLTHRALDDPSHEAAPDVVEVVEKIRDEALRGNANSEYSPPSAWPSPTSARA